MVLRTEVVLVRHATSVRPTADGPDEFGRPLTPAGLQQARALAAELTASTVAAVWSSPYLRAIQTVEPAARALGLEVVTRWELREWDHAFLATADWVTHTEHSWANPSFARPGGESLDQLSARAVAAVRALVSRHPGHRVLVGSHGTFVTRALHGLGFGVDRKFLRDMPMPAVYRLRFDADCEQPEAIGPGLPPADAADRA